MKILIYLPVYKRPEITRLAFTGLYRLMKNSPHEHRVHAVVSETWAKELCDEFGYTWTFCDNRPLGKKMNIGLKDCMSLPFEWDYIMTSGSDNLLSDDIWNLYKPYFEKSIDIFGMDKCHYVDYATGQCKIVDYDKTMLGAGRCHSRRMLEKVACNNSYVEFNEGVATLNGTWNAGEKTYMMATEAMAHQELRRVHIISTGHVKLWPDHINDCLDVNSFLKVVSHASNYVENPGTVPYLCDIKTENNIWDYDKFEGEYSSPSRLLTAMPELKDVFRESRQESTVLHSNG